MTGCYIFGSLSTQPTAATVAQADPGDESDCIQVAVWVSARGEKVNPALSESDRLRVARALLLTLGEASAAEVREAAQGRADAAREGEAERRYDERRARGSVL